MGSKKYGNWNNEQTKTKNGTPLSAGRWCRSLTCDILRNRVVAVCLHDIRREYTGLWHSNTYWHSCGEGAKNPIFRGFICALWRGEICQQSLISKTAYTPHATPNNIRDQRVRKSVRSPQGQRFGYKVDQAEAPSNRGFTGLHAQHQHGR